MALTITIKKDLHFKEIAKALTGDKVGKFAAMEFHRLYEKYVPFREGALYGNVEIKPWQITHTVPYAHYQYEGRTMGRNVPIDGGSSWISIDNPKHYTGGNLDYRKATARAHWDDAARVTELPKLADALQAFVDRGDW